MATCDGISFIKMANIIKKTHYHDNTLVSISVVLHSRVHYKFTVIAMHLCLEGKVPCDKECI